MLWVFDVNETMLDLAPLDEVFERYAGDARLRARWFDLLVRSASVSAATGQYRDFAKLGAGCAQVLGLDEDGIARLAAAMRRLPAYPEVTGALDRLRRRGQRVVALGNSPRAVIEAQLDHAGLASRFDAAYSVEQAGSLKLAPQPYRLVLEAEGVAPRQAVMVAAHDWDIAGAQAVGMRSAFVARGGRRPLPGWPEPDIVAPDLAAAVAKDPA